MKRRSFARLSALALALTMPAIGLTAGIEVRFTSGRLWIHSAGEVSARQLLDAVTRETGVDFVIDPDLSAHRLKADVHGLPLERAVRRILAEIPGIGGQTMLYEPAASGAARLVRVVVFAVGHGPAADAGRAETDAPKAVGVPAPTAPPPDLGAMKKQMIDQGIPAETAEKFVEITNETARLRKTPGAAEEFFRSERYREVMREIAEAQGKMKK